MTAILFDRKKLKLHRDRIADIFSSYDFLFSYYSENLFERLELLSHINNIQEAWDSNLDILEIGARTGILSSKLQTIFPQANIISSDLSDKMLSHNPGKLKIVLDEEFMPFEAESFDIIISNLSMHWVNDVPGVLHQIFSILKNGGIFIGNLFGGDSLRFLRSQFLQAEIDLGDKIYSHISRMIAPHQISSLMQYSGFSSVVVDSEISKISYSSILDLMRDLRYMGESNSSILQENYALTRKILQYLITITPQLFEEEFHIITMIGKKNI